MRERKSYPPFDDTWSKGILWYRWEYNDETERYEWIFNHLEESDSEALTPTPKCEAHLKSWKNAKWRREKVSLTPELPARVVREFEL